jgi:hypothetical protein
VGYFRKTSGDRWRDNISLMSGHGTAIVKKRRYLKRSFIGGNEHFRQESKATS